MMKILVVEDSELQANELSMILRERKFDVIEVHNRQDSVDVYKAVNPDFVFMDIILEDSDGTGIDALKDITKFDKAARVIMCTSIGNQEAIIRECVDFGATGYITKPYNKHEVVRVIESTLLKEGTKNPENLKKEETMENQIEHPPGDYIKKEESTDSIETNEHKPNPNIKTILIVDDSILMHKIISKIVTSEGHIAVTAKTADEAYEKYGSEKPDLIFLDIIIDEEQRNGVQVLKKIRETDSDIPIIMVSSISSADDVIRDCVNNNASDYISKPFEDSDIINALKKYLPKVKEE